MIKSMFVKMEAVLSTSAKSTDSRVEPDLVIIGAPKSGTSSLFYWLGHHPQLQAAVPKETFFFMDAEHPLAGRHGASYDKDGLEQYMRFFPDDRNNRIRFEGTTHYFYQDTARQVLCAAQPQPTIIMLLREPAARVLSSFRFTRDNLSWCDRSLTFDHYVECLLKGKADTLNSYYHARGSLYIAKRQLELNRYVDWLDWWLEYLDPDRLEVILFEELKARPREVMRRLCDRLSVDDGLYENFDFEVKNRTLPVGRQSVHRLVGKLGGRVPSGPAKQWLKTCYLRWQARSAPLDGDYQQGLEALREYFAPWNHRLAQRYELDLEFWWGNSARSDKEVLHDS